MFSVSPSIRALSANSSRGKSFWRGKEGEEKSNPTNTTDTDRCRHSLEVWENKMDFSGGRFLSERVSLGAR